MRKVIMIDDLKEKPVEFTHCFEPKRGWEECLLTPNAYNKIVYLGHDYIDGDIFAAYDNSSIVIYKGHLNSGTY